MTAKEAWDSMMNGKKVRCTFWCKDAYVYFDENNMVVKDNKGVVQFCGIYDTWELYEEPKKLIRVFISQPMNGQSNCEIIEERNKIKKVVEEKYDKDYQIQYLNENLWERPKDWTRIQNLGYSIMNMHDADVVVFAPDWNDAPGCLIEHEVAFFYDKRIYVCEADSHGEYRLF